MLMDRVVIRRYHRDAQGRSVLIGLTFDETTEFETLEANAANSPNHPFWSGEAPPGSEPECRWTDLYLKHETAWKIWRVGSALPELPTSVERIDHGDDQ
jgi:hypothetical protein